MHVLVADDQPKVRSAIRLLLEHDADVEVLGEAVDAASLLDWVEVVCPDLVLLDWELPGQDLEELIAGLRRRCSRVRIVALSGRVEARRQALNAGADAFVSKGDPPEKLLEAIGEQIPAGRAAPSDDVEGSEARAGRAGSLPKPGRRTDTDGSSKS